MKVHGLNSVFKVNTSYFNTLTVLEVYSYLMGKHLHSAYFLSI